MITCQFGHSPRTLRQAQDELATYRRQSRGGFALGTMSRLRSTRTAILAFAILLAAPLAAQDNLPPAPYAYQQLDDPELEAKAHELMVTLRCLKCQSQSIADSDAAMAGDMRHQVRTRIAAGEEPEAIREWLIQRYGDYVSYQPRVTSTTWPLFAIPALLLLGAILILRGRLRKAK